MHTDDSVRQLIRAAAHAAMHTTVPPVEVASPYATGTPARRPLPPRSRLISGSLAAGLVVVAAGITSLRNFQRSENTTTQVSALPSIGAFPVDQPYTYVDTYGAPRMTGTAYQHLHQGVDIFASRGTPVRAIAAGRVFGIGAAQLSGNQLWLRTTSGDCYYYAHLASFSKALRGVALRKATPTPGNSLTVDPLPVSVPSKKSPSVAVAQGTILGYIGSSGNVEGSPPHLHFQIHPGCKGPVNPAAALSALDASDQS
jgi:murein DD-endopeptidase MepM/ murein hydrolase activator NlpD